MKQYLTTRLLSRAVWDWIPSSGVLTDDNIGDARIGFTYVEQSAINKSSISSYYSVIDNGWWTAL